MHINIAMPYLYMMAQNAIGGLTTQLNSMMPELVLNLSDMDKSEILQLPKNQELDKFRVHYVVNFEYSRGQDLGKTDKIEVMALTSREARQIAEFILIEEGKDGVLITSAYKKSCESNHNKTGVSGRQAKWFLEYCQKNNIDIKKLMECVKQ